VLRYFKLERCCQEGNIVLKIKILGVFRTNKILTNCELGSLSLATNSKKQNVILPCNTDRLEKHNLEHVCHLTSKYDHKFYVINLQRETPSLINVKTCAAYFNPSFHGEVLVLDKQNCVRFWRLASILSVDIQFWPHLLWCNLSDSSARISISLKLPYESSYLTIRLYMVKL